MGKSSGWEFEDFLRVLLDNFLKQVVTAPTGGETSLGLVLHNNENMIGKMDVGRLVGCSDHRAVRFNLEREVNHDKNLALVPD